MTRERRVQIGFGVANLFTAALTGFGVLAGLPTRWWLVDGGAVIVVALMAGSGVGLLAARPGAERVARVGSAVVLAIGLALFAALVLTASWLHGVYGAVGKGGATIFALVAAMALPYLVGLPVAELLWLGVRAPTPPREPR